MTTQTHTQPATAGRIDPRGARFAAALTSVVLATVLLLAPGPVAVLLLAAQAVVFGIGAFAGVAATPYSLVFRSFVRPRLGPPAELEDAAPPRFAQAVGLGFAVVGLLGFLLGGAAAAGAGLLGAGVAGASVAGATTVGMVATTVGMVATGLALAAALLNAAFGFCLGCELYLLTRRRNYR